MKQDKKFYDNWLKVDPLEVPVLQNPPQHQPEKFHEYHELKEGEKVIGFQVGDQNYFLDQDQGWRDENGCYYDNNGQPAGWFVLHPGIENHEHYYDQEGLYVPTDIENENSIDEGEGEDEEVDDLKKVVQEEENDVEAFDQNS